jgi:hypothetical protein
MSTRFFYPFSYCNFFLKKIIAVSLLLHARAPRCLPPTFLSTAAPGHILRYSVARAMPHPLHPLQKERQGGMHLHPYPARPSAGREGLRATAMPVVYAGPLLLTSLESELAGYRSSPPDRLWPPTTLYFKCFRCFRLISQVFHLKVTNRSWVLHIL